MSGKWSKERAWEWYNSRPWIRGCNFMPSDCANRIDMWQEYKFEEHFATAEREIALAESIGFNSVRIILEYEVWEHQHDGFMERLDKYLTMFYKHGITAMMVLANDCSVPKAFWKPAHFGEQTYDIGYHGGRRVSPHGGHGELSYHLLDDPATAARYYEFVREIITVYAHDERVLIWNLFNEPGNNRADLSLSHMEKFFEIAREIDPDQPLCADCLGDYCKPGTTIGDRALELSDIISYHNYNDFENNIEWAEKLRLLGRPALDTEWLHRIYSNTVEEIYPLLYLEKIGAYNWGFVQGKYQTHEPWNGIWERMERGEAQFDVTKWQHDLFRPSGRPYDPREINLIATYNKKADERFAKGLDSKLFGVK
ncbi:MAG: cellulase family glycosylhydrolase [Clostridia bacterium]|nr:cellulase family glycosylhydrolase [Clostridia bacterium]